MTEPGERVDKWRLFDDGSEWIAFHDDWPSEYRHFPTFGEAFSFCSTHPEID